MKKLQQVENQLQIIYTTQDIKEFVNTVKQVTKELQKTNTGKELTKEEKDYIWDIHSKAFQRMYAFKLYENGKREEEHSVMCCLYELVKLSNY